MTKFRSKYRIEPNRWIYWDYSAPGKYFLTICINKRECILGNVVHKKMELSEFGEFVETEIKQYRKQRRKMIIPKIMGKLKMQTSKQMKRA